MMNNDVRALMRKYGIKHKELAAFLNLNFHTLENRLNRRELMLHEKRRLIKSVEDLREFKRERNT